VAAHNSPFVRPNNAASNQRLDVIQQLNDGVRMCEYFRALGDEEVGWGEEGGRRGRDRG
jgi:hypothetical protein